MPQTEILSLQVENAGDASAGLDISAAAFDRDLKVGLHIQSSDGEFLVQIEAVEGADFLSGVHVLAVVHSNGKILSDKTGFTREFNRRDLFKFAFGQANGKIRTNVIAGANVKMRAWIQ